MQMANVQALKGAKNGANVRAALMAADYYPFDEEAEVTRVATTVRLTKLEHEQLQFVADVWNAFDKARQIKRSKKWKVASVIERFLAIGLEGFGLQIGGWPSTLEERKQLLKNAAEVAASLEAKRSKK
jgi:hypothetical protein